MRLVSPFNQILATLLLVLGASDLAGQTTWRRTYGGFDTNVGMSVDDCPDGGYILAGSTGSFGIGGQAYVLKIDAFGSVQWTTVIGDNGVQNGMVCRALDDGYILIGSTSTGSAGGYDYYLVRLDNQGTILWERSYGTEAWDLGKDVEQLIDGFIIVGTSYGSGNGDALIVRTDFDGEEVWREYVGGVGEDEGNGVCVTINGDLVVTGAVAVPSDEGRKDAFVARLSEGGELLWTNTFGGDSADYFHSAVETPDGGLACSGGTESYGEVKRILVVKVDAAGDSVWQAMFGSMGDSEAYEIQLNQNADLAIASYNSFNNAGGKDMVLFIASNIGGFILGKNYGGLQDEAGQAVRCTSDGGYITIGTTDGYGPGITSIYVVKSDSTGETADDTVYEMFDDSSSPSLTHDLRHLLCYPNPANRSTRLTSNQNLTDVWLMDTQGRILRAWQKPVPQELDLSGLQYGSYQLFTLHISHTRKSTPLIITGP